VLELLSSVGWGGHAKKLKLLKYIQSKLFENLTQIARRSRSSS
jgi:hypothetical protein